MLSKRFRCKSFNFYIVIYHTSTSHHNVKFGPKTHLDPDPVSKKVGPFQDPDPVSKTVGPFQDPDPVSKKVERSSICILFLSMIIGQNYSLKDYLSGVSLKRVGLN
jgi:hypothetical protein